MKPKYWSEKIRNRNRK